MSTAPIAVLAKQRQASDPALSAWVSANAGSGKTYVLAQRVIRLLLDGTDPAKILCLTFTKAAAANMANRVFGELAKWTALDDRALDEAMHNMGVTQIDAARRERARRLFAQALETPGGLKVQTIHAFCTRLLHQFPFEANVAAAFGVLDDRAQSELLDRARLGVLLDAAASPGSATGRALAIATASVADSTFVQVVNDAIRLRDKLLAWVKTSGSVDAAIAGLCGPLGVTATDTPAQVDADITNGELLPFRQWQATADILKQGGKTETEHAARLEAAVAETGSTRVENYLDVFFTEKRKPRQRVVTQGFEKLHHELADTLAAERDRLAPLIIRRRAVRCREHTAALMMIAHQVIDRYRQEKEKRGQLDYDDLIGRSLDLLKRVDAAWVHYKLDLGIDHVLIDEAQDTSPQQWEIVSELVSEFTAGAGARGSLSRSIFAVGDEKQSIFSFQGAAPDAFANMRRTFQRAYDAAELPMLPVMLEHSFRSLQVILDAVDAVFKQPAAFRGLTADPVPTVHVAVRANAPGHVEIWPLEEPEERPPPRPWQAPFDSTTENNPRATLATKIAKTVRTWIARGDLVGDGDQRRAVRPGDILILVRQRGPQFEAVIRALKTAEVPVAGADRLILTDHIAIMDLMALADALLLPDDDLALATVLKSPLFGLDDSDLFTLAHRRSGSLRSALRAQSDARYAAISTQLDSYGRMAAVETPFTFYSHVLAPERGRAKFLSRLGSEAIDALDEFLELALDYERREVPSLQGYMHWLRAANAEIKRDMEIARNEVRVMTVHGAKGLEAPIVILADSTTPPAGPPQLQPKLFTLPVANAVPGTPDRIIWAARKDDDIAIISDARQKAQTDTENEYRRLLYVAMTRAADRLLVCGAVGERGMPKECWYELIEQALKPTAIEEPADHGDGMVWRWRTMAPDTAVPSNVRALPQAAAPAWLSRAVAPGLIVVAMTPSAADSAVPTSFARNGEDRRLAMLRGSIMHRLLQSLPDVPIDQRRKRAETYLARAAAGFPAEQRETLLMQALRILNDLRFAPLFTPGSRAEVPIVGRVTTASGTQILINGQVDRLVVTSDAVLIADYKTNRPAPRRIDEVPPSYRSQLSEYRALLMKVYPGRAVRAAIIWTDIPDLMEISEAELTRAFEKVTSA
jgi:ATP-dependent helicase/nuclease subunit A